MTRYKFKNIKSALLICFTVCVTMKNTSEPYSSELYLQEQHVGVQFSALVKAVLKFSVKTINFKAAGPITPPDCYKFNIEVNINLELLNLFIRVYTRV